MADKLPEGYEWYTQSPKEFRQELLAWYLSIPRVIVGLVVVLLVTSTGVHLKREPNASILETIFDNLESIALGSAGILFLLEIPDRQKRDHYEAWQVINSAMGQTGSGGRIQALEDLNKDRVDLEGVSAPGADLSSINLSDGRLSRANFENAKLDNANIEKAFLYQANLAGANLRHANLKSADLSEANLKDANLLDANLKSADLSEANLKDANLLDANLKDADLSEANLEGACLLRANLEGANLKEINLRRANLSKANLKGAELVRVNLAVTIYLIPAQLSLAKLCHTTLPDGTGLDPNRDCEELGIDPETGDYIGT